MERAQQRRIAAAAMVLGAVLIIVAVVGMAMNGDDPADEPAAAATTVTSAPTTTTPQPSTTTPTSTTTPASTTTTLPPETVEEFAVEFAAALERGDSDFAFDRLHPVVIAIHDAESCRATVEDRVLLITDYRLAGPVSGPESFDFTVSDRIITVSELYRAPVVFGFQGTEVETEGVFALVDGEMRWFTDCA